MIENLIRTSVEKRTWVIALVFAISVMGWFAFKNLPIDAVPDITNIQVQVNTQAEGLGPEEVERTITQPLEIALNGIPGVTQVRSITRYALSQVTVVFEDGTDIYRARQLISERLIGAKDSLPEQAQPTLGPVTSGLGEIYHYIVEAEKPEKGLARIKQLSEIRAIQDWMVKPRLLSVKGVAEINTIGGHEKQIVIQPDRKKMALYGLHFGDLSDAIGKSNRNTGGGYAEQTGDQFVIQGSGLLKDEEEISQIVVKPLENLRVITLGDVAKVTIDKELRTGAALHNGEEAVLGTVLMLVGENSRTVSERVHARIKELTHSLPKGYRIETLYNRSDLVNSTLSTVEHNLVFGALLVIVVLMALIGNLRAAFITALVIPLSLLWTFISMRVFGISGNLVSLGALDFGIIVDGAVIVLDHCVRKIEDTRHELKRTLSPSEIKETVIQAAIEIRKSAGFGELIIVVVFLPIFAFVGAEGKMFIPMAATFISALVAALILSFTFVPAVSSFLLRGDTGDKVPFLMAYFSRKYEKLLPSALKRSRAIIWSGVISVVIGIIIFSRLGGEFLPKLDEGSIAIQFVRPVSVGISHSVALEEKSHRVVKEFPEVQHVFARIGTSEIATDPMGVNISDSYVMLKPKSEWPKVDGHRRSKDELIQAIVHALESKVTGQRVLVSQPIQLRFNELLEGTRADVSLKIFGDSQDELTRIGRETVEIIEKIPGAGDVELEAKGTLSILDIKPKYAELKRLGTSSSEILETVEVGLGGKEVSTIYAGSQKIPVVVRLPDHDRGDLDAIKSLPVGVHGQGTIPLSDVATVRFKESYSSYSREQTRRRMAILINPRGTDTQSFVEKAQKEVESKIKLPAGYYMEWGGNFKNLNEAKSRMAFLAPLALLLVLLMVYAAFRSVAETLLILAAVPLALIGGVLGLLISQLPFSVSAGVGFIALSGIAVLNGVVLVNHWNDLMAKGISGNTLVEQGAYLRLRPVLMTALVDVFGFIPMAISTGAGSEVQRPLAVVVIGGVLSSTFLTLVVLPVLFQKLQTRFVRKSYG
ncbi:MAG: efflux RND transporter permease subunit [Bdellovibrionales bacterium]|nr:efflux RND transporter permease subunit [Bdellovibrionales bacterium]